MKLPVFKAFGASFAFLFGRLFDVIKIVWLPLALMMGASIWIMPGYFDAILNLSELGPNPDPQAAMPIIFPMLKWFGLLFLVLIVFFIMIYAGLLKFVIRGEKPSLPFYFQFGGDELRILLTAILLGLLLLAVYVGAALAFALVIGGLGIASPQAAAIVGVIAGIVLCVFFIWLCLRLSLSIPAAVGERKIGIGPSWSVTKGNVWRLLGYGILWLIVIGIVQTIFLLVAMPTYLADMQQMISAAGDPARMQELSRQLLEHQRQMFVIGTPQSFIWIAAGYVFALFLYSLMIIAGGVAYRLMTQGDEDAAQAEA